MSEEKDITIFKEKLDLFKIETILKEFPQTEIPILHEFMGGIYTRSIFVPEGTLIIGKRHRYESCNLLLVGEMSIYMGEDMPVKRIKGPLFFKSEPGTKKMAYCHSDVIFINLHPTDKTDVDEIENEFIISEEEYWRLNSGGNTKCLM